MRAAAALVAFTASAQLPSCDPSDPLGLYPEPAREVVAPLEFTGRVVDEAEIIDQDVERVLVDQLSHIEASTQAQVVVVTTPSLDGYDISDYSLALGRGWGIGDAERNDGLLLVVAPNDRKVRIDVGYGLEAAVKDEEAHLIIQYDILPHFREGRYENGILAGVESISVEIENHTAGKGQ